MGPININTDGIWAMAKVGIVASIIGVIAVGAGVIFLLYRGIMSLI